MFLLIKKSNVYIFFFLLIGITSGCSKPCFYQENVEIPCHWHSTLECGVTEDQSDPNWWEAFDDPTLTDLIEQGAIRNYDVLLAESQSYEKWIEAINTVRADIAKNYIEFQGLQQRLIIVQGSIDVQNDIVKIEEGLLDKGFISSIDQNENKKNLEDLFVQKSAIDLSIKKTMFHLSVLLNYAPGELCENLYQAQAHAQELPKLPCEVPVGIPMEIVQRHPSVQEAKKIYEKSKDKQAFYNYQKKILSVLEEAENALASFLYSLEKIYNLENSNKLSEESYELTKDLYSQGLKNEGEVLVAYQAFLNQKNALLESKIEVLINYVNLNRALSSGWEGECE